MSFVDKFKEYSFKKQGFIVEVKTLKNGNSKSAKVLVLKQILPQAINGGVLNLPEVDEISFDAIANLANQTINVINIPASVKVIISICKTKQPLQNNNRKHKTWKLFYG